jgi:dihydropteroate synthase
MAGQVISSAARSELGRRGNQSERVDRDGRGGLPLPATGPLSTRAAASTPAAAVLASSRSLVCGILNVTPDSFYDGGRYIDHAAAVEHGRRLAAEGADLIDVGGESTRPGARPPTVEDELARVVPVIESLSRSVAVPLSVDTSRPEVMREAARAGATMINDVRALRLPGALAAAAELDVPVCLMHMQGEPDRMQDNPVYNDVVADVRRFLADRLRACERAGMDRGQLVVDPGFGFGKTLDHNLRLLRELHELAELGVRVMVGLSRKGMIGAVTGRPVEGRSPGSVAAAMIAAQRGASVFRVHDVAATRDVLALLAAVEHREEPP